PVVLFRLVANPLASGAAFSPVYFFVIFFFFFNDTATTEIYTLSLHDALPISGDAGGRSPPWRTAAARARRRSFRGSGHGKRCFQPLPRAPRNGRLDLAGRARRHEYAPEQSQRQHPRHAAGLHSGRRPRPAR